MKKIFILLFILAGIQACQPTSSPSNSPSAGTMVSNADELKEAIDKAQAGDVITMSDGIWKDIEVRFDGKGTEDQPITIQAETPGKVFIEGLSDLKFGGEWLIVSGLHFRNGHTPSNAVIEFKFNKNQVAMHCRVTNCVIEGFNQLSRDKKDHWVEFWGRHNQLDHCYIAGKANEGPTVRVDIKGNKNIKNYHKIINNHFGPRPRKGGPKGETIQLGDSFSSMSPSYTTVASNLFEKCNGEVEIISSKTNFNEFRNNVFYKSEGSLVTRHGNYCIIDGNYFIGDDNSENIGGIRLINTGHWVTNNYFYKVKGKNFRSPIAVMNGIPKSPLNRYNQVTDVVVAHNTWVDCPSPLQFGVGTNISEKDVLPLSEIRSARPVRTIFANNLIYNSTGDENPIVEHDKADGVLFKGNLISNKGVSLTNEDRLKESKFMMAQLSENVFVPKSVITDIEPYDGFEFETITEDIFGNSRKNNSIGAVSANTSKDPEILDKSKYGTNWYTNEIEASTPNTLEAATTEDLVAKISDANSGDIIILSASNYEIKESLVINKKLTIKSKENQPVNIYYAGEATTPAFEMNPKGELTLQDVSLKGSGSQYAFASLKENMSSHYNLTVNNVEISNFDFVLKAYKQTFAEEITFDKVKIKDCENGLELSQETNDKGDYNVEFLTIDNCEFDNVKSNVIDYYRGGYDESTIGGNLTVTNSKFTRSGKKESNGILLNTTGIVNVDISNNTFTNNKVKLVARLWGAKNNTHSNNTITKSGELIVVENLELTLVY